jgi:SAM-dependent methyltransferase
MEAAGHSVHDEARLVERVLERGGLATGGRVLDAGCGTGRVAAELARGGRSVVGVDNDDDLLIYARRKPEPVEWILADLATVSLSAVEFDVVVMAGNVLPFVEPNDRATVVSNLARHLGPDGRLIIGASAAPQCGFELVDRWCADAGLGFESAWSTWSEEPFDGGDYRVSVHHRAPSPSN